MSKRAEAIWEEISAICLNFTGCRALPSASIMIPIIDKHLDDLLDDSLNQIPEGDVALDFPKGIGEDT